MNRKIFILAVLLMMFELISQAQNQSIAFNPNMLAYSQGLPNDFLLFSPDTSVQILFNPARAALTERRFVYANYSPYSNVSSIRRSSVISSYYGRNYSTPTLSIATLFDAAGSTWLFQISNWIYRNTDDQTSSMNNNSSKSNISLTSAKLSLVGTLNDNPYSIGVFGIINPNTSTSNTDHYDVSYVNFGERYSDNQDHTKSEGTNSMYLAGIEFSLSGAAWDFIAQLSIQRNNICGSSFNSSLSYQDYRYPLDTTFYSRSLYQESSMGTTEPLMYTVYAFFQHKADVITSNDYYFISPTLYYSDGKLFYNQSRRISENQLRIDTTGSITSNYYWNNGLQWNLRTKNWGGAISFGYMAAKKIDDFDFITGFNPKISYDRFIDMPSASSMISSINEHKLWSVGFTIPIYLNFKPASWCSVFGGLNYQYNYYSEKSDDSQLYFYESSSHDTIPLQSREISNLSSASNVYAGMELRHSSGLHVQIAFNNSLSSYSGWNISIGYIY